MRIEKEIVETENGFTKDGIDYNHLKTYSVYSDKGTFVGNATIECTSNGMEPGTSPSFQAKYESLIERAKKLDEEEAEEEEAEEEEESNDSSDSGAASEQSTGNSGGEASGIGSEGSNAPGYGDTEIAIDVEPKDPMLRAGEPTNSMATGEPKEYNAAESLAVIAGSGVAVAALAANAGGLANAAADIASAAVAAAAEKAAAVIAEYTAKFAALPASVPVKIADYTGARVGKTKDDKNRNGIAYDPVKLSIGDLLGMGEMNTESLMKEMDKSNEEIAKNKKTEEVQKKLKKVSDSVNQKLGKSAEVIGEIMTHVLEGPEWIQQQIDKEVSRVEQNVRSELETGYKKAEEEINTFCENEGDKIGAVIVEQYNKTVTASAKTIIDNKNKAISKAKIKSNAAIQKAKLKIFALIGL